jgi:biotin carboxylase
MEQVRKPPLLHVLGGGPWQVPTVRLAKSMGYRVLVTDYYEDRPAYSLADHHEVVDITDREATLEVTARYGANGILCDTTDVGVATAAYVAERLGLPGMGYEVGQNFTHKGRMRLLTRQAGLRIPPFRLLRQGESVDFIPNELGLPLLVKPVDSQSGKGVSLVRDQQALRPAFELALANSREGSVLIETMLDGTEFIVDGFMLDHEVHILGLARKTRDPRQPTVSSRITYGERLPEQTEERLVNANRATLAALGQISCVFHAEYIFDGEHAIPIDVAARGGGCMIYTHVLPYISGVNANRCMIELALGKKPQVVRTRNLAANIEFMALPEGVLEAFEGLDVAAGLPGVLGLHFNLSAGDWSGPLTKKDDRPGYVVTGADSAEAAIDIGRDALSRIRVRMQNGIPFSPLNKF